MEFQLSVLFVEAAPNQHVPSVRVTPGRNGRDVAKQDSHVLSSNGTGRGGLLQQNVILGSDLKLRGKAPGVAILSDEVYDSVFERGKPLEIYPKHQPNTSGGPSVFPFFQAMIFFGSTWMTILFQNQPNFSRSARNASM